MGIKSLEELEAIVNGTAPEAEAEPQAPAQQPAVEGNQAQVAPSTEQPATGEPQAQLADSEGAVAQPEAYVPNFTYKVKDSEKEFDERIKTVIKSKEDEDFYRQLVTKAEGLDSYREKVKTYEDKEKSYSSTISDLQGKIAMAADFYTNINSSLEKKDLRSVFEALKLDDTDVLRFAMQLAQESEMPAEQRAQIEAQRNLQKQSEEMLMHNKLLAEQYTALQTQYMGTQQQELVAQQSAQVNGHIGRYADLNSKLSEAGINMFDEVVREGHKQYLATGVEPSDIGAIVDSVAGRFSKLIPAAPVIVTPPAAVSTPRPQPQVTLPKINGDSATPVAKRYTSLEQIKADFDAQYNQSRF